MIREFLKTDGRYPKRCAMIGSWNKREWPYFSVLGEINLERLRVILETQRGHGEEDVLAINGFPLFLVAFLGSWQVV
jgi:hypothetical protein